MDQDPVGLVGLREIGRICGCVLFHVTGSEGDGTAKVVLSCYIFSCNGISERSGKIDTIFPLHLNICREMEIIGRGPTYVVQRASLFLAMFAIYSGGMQNHWGLINTVVPPP